MQVNLPASAWKIENCNMMNAAVVLCNPISELRVSNKVTN